MFMDNLDGQVNPSFKDILKQANCTRFLLPPETTDHTQPVDGGLRKSVKGEISNELEQTGCIFLIDGSEDDRVKICGINISVKPIKDIDQQLFCQ